MQVCLCESPHSVLCGATGLGEHYNTLGGNCPNLISIPPSNTFRITALSSGTWTSHNVQDNQTGKEMWVFLYPMYTIKWIQKY